jgi:hypothetical protein
MFHRVITEDWQQFTPVIGFWITFVVFIIATIRALLTRRDQCRHLSCLPLDDKPDTQTTRKDS